MKLGVLVFDGFELLDVFGPLEMLGQLHDELSIEIIAEKLGAVASAQEPSICADVGLTDTPYDIIMIPGGRGTRTEVNNTTLIQWIAKQAAHATYVTSVCTGAALLAKAGVLNGKRATTNKLAYGWVTSLSTHTTWIAKARWVQDGNLFTSAGVSAGIDMSLALIAHIWGNERANAVADWAEYRWSEDPDDDVFAGKYGLG